MSSAGWMWLTVSMGVSLVGAAWRWPDSAHALGVLRQGGGGARHPVVLTPGPRGYTLIVTAPVLRPWRGDARLAIEGEPQLGFEAQLSGPVVDFRFHHLPKLEGRVLRGLRPGDRIALWLNVAAPELDPVCGMRCAAEPRVEVSDQCFCSIRCRDTYLSQPGLYTHGGYRGQQLQFTMRDDRTGELLLTIPIALGGQKGGSHGGHH